MPNLKLVSNGHEFGTRTHMANPLNVLAATPVNEGNDMQFGHYDLTLLQREQYLHDIRNHQDIWYLHKNDRLKHYGLHFSKYVGRLARGNSEAKPLERTLVDAFLVALSSSNTIAQNLSECEVVYSDFSRVNDYITSFADAAGRYCDACEKIDHLEDYGSILRAANLDIISWVLSMARGLRFDLYSSTLQRRGELAKRPFYIGS